MQKKRRPLLPRETLLPLTAAVGVHFLSYYLPKKLNRGRPHTEFCLKADQKVPLKPGFILPYVGAYGQWIGHYLHLARRSPGTLRRTAAASVLAETAGFACFLAKPTTITRPEVKGSGPCAALTRLIYAADRPVNLFPSLHCLQSWLCWRSAGKAPELSRGYARTQLAITLPVCASTVLVKQHYLPDIAGGIAAAELGLYLTRPRRKTKEAAK